MDQGVKFDVYQRYGYTRSAYCWCLHTARYNSSATLLGVYFGLTGGKTTKTKVVWLAPAYSRPLGPCKTIVPVPDSLVSFRDTWGRKRLVRLPPILQQLCVHGLTSHQLILNLRRADIIYIQGNPCRLLTLAKEEPFCGSKSFGLGTSHDCPISPDYCT